MKKNFENLYKWSYPDVKHDEMTEEEALKKLNSQEPVTPKETMDILMSICNSVDKRAGELPERILGAYSYYEGQLNGLLIAIKLFTRLNQSSPQVTEKEKKDEKTI